MTAPAGASPRRYFVLGALIVVGAALFTAGLHSYGVLDRWENDNLDRLLRTKAPQQSGDLVLVTIDDNDYATLFEGESPLRQDLVTDLLVQLSRAGPRVIGVDLDTSHWVPDRPSALDGLIVPIVWARDTWKEDSKDRIGKVRGRDDVSGLCTGVPAMRLDADGIVRRTYTVWNVGHVSLPSFPLLLAERYRGVTACEAHQAQGHGDNEEPINFLTRGYGFKRFTANAVLSLAKSATWVGDPDFDNRIVLLGGTYRAARDQYVTPIGLMDGVEAIAHVTQNHISSDRVRVAGHLAHFLAEVSVGLTLLAILFFLPPRWKLVVLLGTVFIAIATSFLLFRTSAYFFSFIPVLAGLRIHETIEQFLERRHLQQENESLRKKLGVALRLEPVAGPPTAKSEPGDAGEMQEIPPT